MGAAEILVTTNILQREYNCLKKIWKRKDVTKLKYNNISKYVQSLDVGTIDGKVHSSQQPATSVGDSMCVTISTNNSLFCLF